MSKKSKERGLGGRKHQRRSRFTDGQTPAPIKRFDRHGQVSIEWYLLGEHSIVSAPPANFAKTLAETLSILLPGLPLKLEARINMMRERPRGDTYFQMLGGVRDDGVHVLLYSEPSSDICGRSARLSVLEGGAVRDENDLHEKLRVALTRFPSLRLSRADLESLRLTGRDREDDTPIGRLSQLLAENVAWVFLSQEINGFVREYTKPDFVRRLRQLAKDSQVRISEELATQTIINGLAQRGLIRVIDKTRVVIGWEGSVCLMRDMGMIRGTDQEARISYERRKQEWLGYLREAAHICKLLDQGLADRDRLLEQRQELQSQLEKVDGQVAQTNAALTAAWGDLTAWESLYNQETDGRSLSYIRELLNLNPLKARFQEVVSQSA